MARQYTLSEPKIDYIVSLYAKEDVILKKIRLSIPHGREGMVIGAEEGKILCILLRLIKAKHVLELGTFVGYSTLWLARGVESQGSVISIEKDISSHALAVRNISLSEVSHQVTLLQGDAVDMLNNHVFQHLLDAVFIDADKINYPLYLELIMDKLRSGGLIIADNTLLFNTIYRDTPADDARHFDMWNAMQQFNHLLADEERFQSIMLPTQEGLTVAIKK